MKLLRKTLSIVTILTLFGCVDRVQFDTDLPQSLPVSVSGHITNQPGPYKIYLNSSFDIESKSDPKIPISAKCVNLLDELGNNEELVEVEAGVYQTSSTQGRVGGVYKIRIEFEDDRVYESIPDTLLAPGEIDSLYFKFTSKVDYSGAPDYGFDVFVNAQRNEYNDSHYMWQMTGTFKTLTHPEWIRTSRSQCFPLYDEGIICNFLPPCSGLRNISPIGQIPPEFTRVHPCECCTCWYKLFNYSPVLSDNFFNSGTGYREVSIYRVPLNTWIFMYKIHVEVAQFALTRNSFQFFKRIREQKESVTSLFQPALGKIPSTFIQIQGTTTPIEGIFYASGVYSKYVYITPDNIPPPITVPRLDLRLTEISCLDLFPNATNVKPYFWQD